MTHVRNILIVVSLIAAIFVVRWIVTTQRPPGAMTVVEAQAMDMTTMKAPPGVQPVGVEEARSTPLAPSESFPATVRAYHDEDVVARVPGRIVRMPVYPGDRVSAGQLVAELDSAEFVSKTAEAGLISDVAAQKAAALQADVDRLDAAVTARTASVQAAQSRVRKAEAEADAARIAVAEASRSVEQAQASVSSAEAELRYAQADLGREKALYDKGAISLDEVQAAETRRDRAAAMVEEAKAMVAAKREAEAASKRRADAAAAAVEGAQAEERAAGAALQEARRAVRSKQAEVAAAETEQRARTQMHRTAGIMQGYTRLTALSSGMVAERVVSPGTLVEPGMTLLRIKVLDRVRVQAPLPERLLPKVREGSPVTITAGDLTRQARITSVFPEVDTRTRTFVAEAVVPNGDVAIVPGMFVRMHVATGKERMALTVPESAIRRDADGNPFVWVLHERSGEDVKTDYTCTMHPEVSEPGPGQCPICKMDLVPRKRSGKYVAVSRQVTIGGTGGGRTEILSGLEAGAQVIFAGYENLRENLAVAPVPWGPNGPLELPKPEGGATGHDHGGMAPPSGGSDEHDHSGMDMPSGDSMRHDTGDGQSMRMDHGNGQRQTTKPVPSAGEGYVCPMHSDVTSDKPGTCPKCKMDLVPAEEAQ